MNVWRIQESEEGNEETEQWLEREREESKGFLFVFAIVLRGKKERTIEDKDNGRVGEG